MFGTSLGLLLSLVGLLTDKRKSPAIMGAIISGAIFVVGFVIPMVLASLR